MSPRPIILLLLLAATTCSRPGGDASQANKNIDLAETEEENRAIPPPVYQKTLPEGLKSLVDTPFTGDLEAMVKRRIIRVAAPFNRTYYFVDAGAQRGLSYEYMKLFE